MTGNINYTIIETIFCMQGEVEILDHRLENTIDTRILIIAIRKAKSELRVEVRSGQEPSSGLARACPRQIESRIWN